MLDDAVATQDTVTQLISAIRRTRRLIPQAAAVAVTAHDYDRAGKPAIAWDDPIAKAALITGLVNDARAILDALDGVALTDEQAEAVGLLALVAGQDVEPGDTDGTWRIAQRVAPDRMISTVDPEARHMHKSVSEYRDGYKAHIAVEPETGLITAAAITPANAADGRPASRCSPARNPACRSSPTPPTAAVRPALRSANARHRQAIKAIPLRPAVPGGFDRDDFLVDHAPAPSPARAVRPSTITAKGHAIFGVRCRGCPLRDRCTTAKDGRTIHVREHDAELVEARRAWRDGDFADDYRRWRPMVERSIAWLVAHGHRRVRYRGIERNRLGLSHRVAALNLRRLINLGLTRNGPTWVLTQNGPGNWQRETTHGRSHQGGRLTLSRRLFGSAMNPGPPKNYDTTPWRGSALFNSVLVVDHRGRRGGEVVADHLPGHVGGVASSSAASMAASQASRSGPPMANGACRIRRRGWPFSAL